MGLAASQSRLLMLTMRKNDVESGLMSIANDKLSLSRQSAQLSQNYSNALNATRLAWDLGDSTTDLSYALLMTPNATETANQYLLTNNYGAIILNDSYAQKLGLGASGSGNDFKSQYPSAIAFVHKFGISDTTAQKARDAVNNGNTNINALKLTSVGTQVSNLGATVSSYYGGTSQFTNFASVTNVPYSIGDGDTWQDERDWIRNHQKNTDIHGNLGDFTQGGWSFNNQKDRAQDALKTKVDVSTVLSSVDSVLSAVGTALQSSIQSELGTLPNSVFCNYMTGIKKAIEYATKTTEMVVVYNATPPTDAKSKAPSGSDTNGFKNSGYLNFDCSDGSPDDLGTNDTDGYHDQANGHWMGLFNMDYKLDNKKVINTFMYYFDMYVADNINNTVDPASGASVSAEFNNGTNTDKTFRNSESRQNYSAWNTSSRAKTVPVTTEVSATPTEGDDINTNSISDYYEAVYYVNLYNALAQKGWAVDSNIDNKSYLEKQVLYGNVNVQKLKSAASSTWETVSTSDYDSPVTSEADSAAVTKAEAEYTAAKNKLDYKESQLDIQSTTLDTERSAVTTEIDSVNAIIKKNLDAFKVFESNG